MDGVSVDKRPSYLQYRAYIEFNENTINNVYAQCYICGQVQDQAYLPGTEVTVIT